MSAVQAILKYPGAKWRLANWLHQYTPHCARVIDAYCGSAAFALTLPYRPAHLILNDRDDHIVHLFRVLREQPDALLRAVALTPWSRAEYLACAGPAGSIIATGDPVEDARRFLVITWQAHGTTICTRNGWRHKGVSHEVSKLAGTYEPWQQLPERLAAVVEVLRDAEIESMPAVSLIPRYATADTLIYADPPYVRQTTHGKRKALYRHEMSDADHLALIDVLDAHPGPVMLSGYDNHVYARRLSHWHRVTTQTQAEKGNTRTEALWLNAAACTTVQQSLWRAEPAQERRDDADALATRCAAFGWTLTRTDDGRLWLTGNGAPAVFGRAESLDAWLTVQERAERRRAGHETIQESDRQLAPRKSAPVAPGRRP